MVSVDKTSLNVIFLTTAVIVCLYLLILTFLHILSMILDRVSVLVDPNRLHASLDVTKAKQKAPPWLCVTLCCLARGTANTVKSHTS